MIREHSHPMHRLLSKLSSRFPRWIQRGTALAQKIACQLGFGLAFYGFNALLWQRISRWQWVHRLFHRDVELLRRFCEEVAPPDLDFQEAAGQHIFAQMVLPTLAICVQKLPPRELDRFFAVQGWERITSAQAEGKGVILAAYHTFVMWTAHLWLRKNTSSPWIAIQEWAKSAPNIRKNDPTNNTLLGAADILSALEVLDAKGIVFILPDAYRGKQGIAIDFMQRKREFQPTFAELALLTGTAILPVSATLLSNGTVTIRIGAEFELGDDVASDEEATRIIIQQYVDFLKSIWFAQPDALKKSSMRKYLELPFI